MIIKLMHSAGCIVFKETKRGRYYLLLQNRSGYWDFPQGRIERDETAFNAAIRELREETGIEMVHIFELFKESISYHYFDCDQNKVEKTVDLFLACVDESTSITISSEHTAYEWLSYNEVIDRLTYHPVCDIVIKVEQLLAE